MQATIYLCLMDIASGMDYLHSLGVLHGDVKGANVLLKTTAPTPYDARGFVCKVPTPLETPVMPALMQASGKARLDFSSL